MSNHEEVAKPGQYLTFCLGKEQYGVPIEVIREINRVTEITPVPKTPSYIKGVMNLRGKIIPVINLRIKFNMEPLDYTRDTCIIVIDTPSGQLGTIVDAVKEVVDLKSENIQPPPVLGDPTTMQFIKAMGKQDDRVIILVDIVQALTPENLTALQSIVKESSNAA